MECLPGVKRHVTAMFAVDVTFSSFMTFSSAARYPAAEQTEQTSLDISEYICSRTAQTTAIHRFLTAND